MAFNSVTFIVWFLPFFVLLCAIALARHRTVLMIGASLVFYSWGTLLGPVLIASALIDYMLINRMGAGRARSKAVLVSVIAFNLVLLGYFKYTNFLLDQINMTAMAAGAQGIGWRQTLYPLGISFIIFHRISYALDVHGGRVEGRAGLADYLLYITYFPKLLQGPITKFRDFSASVAASRGVTFEGFSSGMLRFCVGLAKKILIADALGSVYENVLSAGVGSVSSGQAWAGAVCIAFQIYFDFSGYTDMALGVSAMVGIRLPENFNRPYMARNITEFWQRWHMTLSAWFKEYLYIPLGGNRVSPARTMINLWIVFLVSGIWHGANWTFIVWGAMHGLFLTLDRLGLRRLTDGSGHAVAVPLNFLVLVVTWVFFYAVDISSALEYLGRMFSAAGGSTLWVDIAGNREAFVIALAALLSFMPDGAHERLMRRVSSLCEGQRGITLNLLTSLLLLTVSAAAMMNNVYKPYIYLVF